MCSETVAIRIHVDKASLSSIVHNGKYMQLLIKKTHKLNTFANCSTKISFLLETFSMFTDTGSQL